MNFKVFLTNLGKYNEGHLIGEWIELPIDGDKLKEVLDRIGINEMYEEYFITDYENDFNYKVNEYDSLKELNEVAKRLQDLSNNYGEELLAAMLDFHLTIDDVVYDLENKCCRIVSDNNLDDIGMELLEELGYLSGVPESLRYYIDGERWLKDNTDTVQYLNNGNYLIIF